MISMAADANREISALSPVCTFCRHQFAYRRCAAFHDGIPLAIWLGRNTHQSPYPGDHDIHFEAIPGASVTTPRVTEGDKVLWPLIDDEPVRELQPV